jgi:hypothetical protein
MSHLSVAERNWPVRDPTINIDDLVDKAHHNAFWKLTAKKRANLFSSHQVTMTIPSRPGQPLGALAVGSVLSALELGCYSSAFSGRCQHGVLLGTQGEPNSEVNLTKFCVPSGFTSRMTTALFRGIPWPPREI